MQRFFKQRFVIFMIGVVLMGCQSVESGPQESTHVAKEQHKSTPPPSNNQNANGMVLTSVDFTEGGNLPVEHTCDGARQAPEVRWHNVPDGTKSLVLIMHHEAGPSDIHTYWIVYNISPDQTNIGKTIGSALMGANTVNGENEYSPPCSKGPGLKWYTLTLYALSDKLDMSSYKRISREDMLKAMSDTTLAAATLNVGYERTKAHDTNKGSSQRPPSGNGPDGGSPEFVETQTNIAENAIPAEQSDNARCQTIDRSIKEAGFGDKATVRCDDTYAYITSDTYPDHELMNGITGPNEQVPVPAPGYTVPVSLKPEFSKYLTVINAAMGVAVNGVPIYGYVSQGDLDIYTYSKKHDTIKMGQLDNCGGHAGRGDDYHYHAKPTCMIDAMKNKSDAAIIGWGYDGYPLYGDNNPDGTAIVKGKLDVCNGQLDETYGYRYHTSDIPPYIIQCLVGEVNTNILPRVHPLNSTSKIRMDLRPPQGSVQNLTYTQNNDGSRTMRYEYHGKSYFVTYAQAGKDNCYLFTQKTISNGGKLETGTFCRTNRDK